MNSQSKTIVSFEYCSTRRVERSLLLPVPSRFGQASAAQVWCYYIFGLPASLFHLQYSYILHTYTGILTSTMHLFDLPDELLDLCCWQIDHLQVPLDLDEQDISAQVNRDALRNLRLTSKRISPIATKQLFSRLHLYPTKSSAQTIRAVLDHERLNPLVNTLSLQTSIFGHTRHDDDPEPTWSGQDEDDLNRETEESDNDEEHAIDTDGKLPATFKRTLNAIGLFRSLRRIELKYDDQVEGPTADAEDRYEPDVKETREYRDTFFRKLLRALNHPDHPASKLTSISIMHLQDWVNAEVATSSDYKALLSRLESLELCIVSERDSAAPENEMLISERHDFYSEQLRKFWLQPLQEIGKLTNLKLYGMISWGYLPKCDLRGLHFPKLRSLSLGNMTFTHDWQLEWIVSHGSSLESLTLHNCPIIPDTELSHRLDADNYPILTGIRQPTGRGKPVQFCSKYAARWHHYFHRFRTELPRLRHLAVTHGTWLIGDSGDYAAARMFASKEILPAEIRVSRYCRMRG
jgi:hypothetical protein